MRSHSQAASFSGVVSSSPRSHSIGGYARKTAMLYDGLCPTMASTSMLAVMPGIRDACHGCSASMVSREVLEARYLE